DWVGDTASDVADWAGGAAADAASWAGGAAADVFDAAANFTDDTIFDSVDFITGGVIDVDYDGGNFSANIGIDDVAKFGVSVGEDGFKGSFDTAIADGNVAITDEGFSLSGSAGIDFGPLPYAEGHLAVSAD